MRLGLPCEGAWTFRGEPAFATGFGRFLAGPFVGAPDAPFVVRRDPAQARNRAPLLSSHRREAAVLHRHSVPVFLFVSHGYNLTDLIRRPDVHYAFDS